MPDCLSRRRLLDALLESIDDAVVSISLDGTIENWSAGAERLYGYRAEEMRGQPLRRLTPVYEQPALEELQADAKNGVLRASEITERLRKNGSKIRVEARRTIIRNDFGEIAGVLERAKELSWRKSDLPEEGQLRLMAQQMPGAVWTTDLDLRITSICGSALVPLRIFPRQLLGRSICEFFGSCDRYATPILEHQEALHGASSHFEYPRNNFFLEVHVGALRSASGEIIGTIGLGVDITERKKTEDEVRYKATHDA